jgi:hypothetical protein
MEESGSTVKTPFTFLSFDGYGLPAEADEEEVYSSREAGGARRARQGTPAVCGILQKINIAANRSRVPYGVKSLHLLAQNLFLC